MPGGISQRLGDAAHIAVFRDVVLPPVSSAQNHFGFNVGAYTSDGHPLTEFRLRRIGGAETVEPEFPASFTRLDIPATYGGLIDFHFGHFMLETLSRQWWVKSISQGPIIWHRQIPHDLMPWQVEIFSLCGIDVGRFLYVSDAILARELSVAEPGVVIDISYLRLWSESMGVFPFRAPIIGKKVWMSRSEMPANYGHVTQELEIEEILASQGWNIVHPHLMSNTDLLYLVSDAAVISGFAASAYFILLLARNCRARIRMVDRGGMGIPPVFVDYAVAKNLQQEILRPKMERVSGAGAKGTFKLECIDDVIEFVNG